MHQPSTGSCRSRPSRAPRRRSPARRSRPAPPESATSPSIEKTASVTMMSAPTGIVPCVIYARLRAREAAAVDDRRVIQSVRGDHPVRAQRRDHARVGEEPRAEQHARLGPLQLGEPRAQLPVRRHVPRDQRRRPRPGAPARSELGRGRRAPADPPPARGSRSSTAAAPRARPASPSARCALSIVRSDRCSSGGIRGSGRTKPRSPSAAPAPSACARTACRSAAGRAAAGSSSDRPRQPSRSPRSTAHSVFESSLTGIESEASRSRSSCGSRPRVVR